MRKISLRLRGVLIAIVALAMSAGLAFGAEPPSAASSGLANAAGHAGKLVPVAGGEVESAGDEDTEEDEESEEAGDEDPEEDEESEETGESEGEDGTDGEASEEAGDNCLTEPTVLTDEELAAMNHGSIVCWAAHQETWPEEFKNHGAWVSSWAHAVKGGEASATAKDKGKGNGKGKGKGKGHQEE